MVRVNKTNSSNQEKYEIANSDVNLKSAAGIEVPKAKLVRQESKICRGGESKNEAEAPSNASKKAMERNRRVILIDYAKTSQDLHESLISGYDAIISKFYKLLDDMPVALKGSIQAESSNRLESILTTNLNNLNNNKDLVVSKKPKGKKRKKKLNKSTMGDSSLDEVTSKATKMNETQILTRIAARTADMLANSTESIAADTSTASKLDKTYQVQVKHTEVVVEKSTTKSSATVKLTAETCLKRTGRLESVDENADINDSTLKSKRSGTRLPSVIKKKKKEAAITSAAELSEIMPNPLASSSIMQAKQTTATYAKTPGKNLALSSANIPAGAKTPKTSTQLYAAISASGKVKKMIEEVEARIKSTPAINNPNLRSATTAAKRLQYSSTTVGRAAQALKNLPTATSSSKLRSSIDKRKQRVSGAKATTEAKRASLRKVNALLKDLNGATDHVDNAARPRPLAPHALNEDESTLSIASSVSASSSGVCANGKKASARELLGSSHLIQQNYKLMSQPPPLPTTTTTATLKVANAASSLTNSARKTATGFNKFLERNTPCKLTQTELDEKRKNELALKEKKEQERVYESKKQLMEKAEMAKKKREERMKKINDARAQKEEEERRKKEELEARQRELDEFRKRMQEEKKREELERQQQLLAQQAKAKELMHQQQQHHQQQHHQQQQQKAMTNTTVTVLKNQINNQNTFVKPPTVTSTKTGDNPNITYDSTMTFKVPNPPGQYKTYPTENKPPISTLPSLNKPSTASSASASVYKQNYTVTVAATASKQAPPQTHTYENYQVDDLHSNDETDDEEEPSKPIPAWAQEPQLTRRAVGQSKAFINFTKIFRATSHADVDLASVFKGDLSKNAKLHHHRSSSANWTTPPVWSTGINGNESFWLLHK